MTESIRNQCSKLYIDAFHDDIEFTNLLFDTFFEDSCRYLLIDGKVVSMLFAMDVSIDNKRGKYVYAVATNEKYRGKGYMRRLLDEVSDEFSKDYSFLCLRPMDDGLFNFYEKLGFERKFTKSTVSLVNKKSNSKGINIEKINDIKYIRNLFLPENSVEYSENMLKLIMSYCDAFTDSLENPSYFIIKEKISGKVKEAIGRLENIPECVCKGEAITYGNSFDYAMFKSLGWNFAGNGYLGLALD